MRVPGFLFPQTAEISPYEGRGGTGKPIYGTKKTSKCRIESKRINVTTDKGNEYVYGATGYFPHDVVIPNGSLITVGAREYVVLDVDEKLGFSGISHVVVVMR